MRYYLLTPRDKSGQRHELHVSKQDMQRWVNCKVQATLTDLECGKVTLRRAPCGLGCYCDAILIERSKP